MAKEIEEQLPAKPVGFFPKATSHRTNKEMTEEKKYEIRDDDGNINFTGEHQLDDTEDISRVNTNDSDGRSILQNEDGINRTNTNDSDGRSILQNHDGGQYQGQHTASSWAYNNQTCTMLLPGSVVYNFPKYYKFFKARMRVNINVFFCFTAATTASICINTSVHHC